MGFREKKQQVLECLKRGQVLHQQRSSIDIKNLLAVGDVSMKEVATLIARANGDDYRSSPHHFDDGIEVNIIATRQRGQRWYIKWYFIEPNSVFISVHH